MRTCLSQRDLCHLTGPGMFLVHSELGATWREMELLLAWLYQDVLIINSCHRNRFMRERQWRVWGGDRERDGEKVERMKPFEA